MSEQSTGRNILEIMRLLPHRYPFLLVDRILEYEPGQRAVGLKNVTVNEASFQGHFPGRPVMPATTFARRSGAASTPSQSCPMARHSWRGLSIAPLSGSPRRA